MRNRRGFVSAIVTLLIVALLILSGPAEAVTVSISGLSGTITQGTSTSFTVNINLNSNGLDTYVPLENITLLMSGATSKQWVFALNGTVLSGGSGLSVSAPSLAAYYGYGTRYGYDTRTGYGYSFGTGYGYGYGYGAGGASVDLPYTITLDTSVLSTGSYTAVARANVTGNASKPYFESSSVSFSIAAPSAAEGGGGGVSGLPPSLPGVTVDVSVTKSIDFGVAGRSYTVNLAYPGLPVTEVSFSLLQSVKDFSVTAQKISGPPTGVDPAPGKVYSYLNIFIGVPSAFYDSTVTIKFNVDRAWLTSQGVSENDIVLMVNKDGKWVQLPTNIVSKNGVISYQASSTSFSIFAISTAVVPPVTPTPTPTPVTTPAVSPTAPTPTATPKPFPGFEAAVAIAAIAAIYLLRKRGY